jgi:hypothetical protein
MEDGKKAEGRTRLDKKGLVQAFSGGSGERWHNGRQST